MQAEFKRSDLIDAGWDIQDVDDDIVMIQRNNGRETVYLRNAGETLIELSADDF